MTAREDWDEAQTASELIGGIGRQDFPARLLTVYQRRLGCDFCSAFTLEEEGAGPRLIFAAGRHERIPDFARRASAAYAARYWREDRAAILKTRHRADQSFDLIARRATDIPNPAYRTECYDRGEVDQRFSIISSGARPILISGYRRAMSGSVAEDALPRIGSMGAMLIALVKRHDELTVHERPMTASACRETYRIRALDAQLSDREAKVVASLAVGDRQQDIADELGLAVTSVVTYRRRAYRKLGVQDRRELRRLLDEPGTERSD